MSHYRVIPFAMLSIVVLMTTGICTASVPLHRDVADWIESDLLSARNDTLFYFAPSGSGSYGTTGTNERGFDFNGAGECMGAGWTAEGAFARLIPNDFLPGENETCMWTFFDPDTVEEGYPMGVYPYGPPYWDMHIESPPLELDQNGDPMALYHGQGSLILNSRFYWDMPLDALIFVYIRFAVRDSNGNYYLSDLDNYVYHGEHYWFDREWDLTERAFELLGSTEEPITGIKVRISTTDLCPSWCDVYGSGYPHTLAVLMDDISLAVVPDATSSPEETGAATPARMSAHPNPFNPGTTLSFTVDSPGRMTLSIHDLSGRLVRKFETAELATGKHRIEWNGVDQAGMALGSGVYLAQLRQGERLLASEKLTLLK